MLQRGAEQLRYVDRQTLWPERSYPLRGKSPTTPAAPGRCRPARCSGFCGNASRTVGRAMDFSDRQDRRSAARTGEADTRTTGLARRAGRRGMEHPGAGNILRRSVWTNWGHYGCESSIPAGKRTTAAHRTGTRIAGTRASLAESNPAASARSKRWRSPGCGSKTPDRSTSLNLQIAITIVEFFGIVPAYSCP